MEKAILKTLIYADIFDYPLNIREIHKWLVGKKTEPREIEKALKKMNQESRIKNQGKYYFLPGRKSIVNKRRARQKESYIYIRKVKVTAWFLKVIPWIKLIGISGGLSMENAGAGDDIDLFVVTTKKRLWISRLLILGILTLLRQRRKKSDSRRDSAGKICCNIILEENQLEQERKDIYVSHEVLQMKVLWQRDGVYSKYLSANDWAFKYLPNWVGDRTRNQESRITQKRHKSILDLFEKYARNLQLNLMKKPLGLERISDGAVYFHPNDYRQDILLKYRERLAVLDKKRSGA